MFAAIRVILYSFALMIALFSCELWLDAGKGDPRGGLNMILAALLYIAARLTPDPPKGGEQ